jgi:hypothetical protein
LGRRAGTYFKTKGAFNMRLNSKINTGYNFILFGDKAFTFSCHSPNVIKRYGLGYYGSSSSTSRYPLIKETTELKLRVLLESVLKNLEQYPEAIKKCDWETAISIEEAADELGNKNIIAYLAKARAALRKQP